MLESNKEEEKQSPTPRRSVRASIRRNRSQRYPHTKHGAPTQLRFLEMAPRFRLGCRSVPNRPFCVDRYQIGRFSHTHTLTHSQVVGLNISPEQNQMNKDEAIKLGFGDRVEVCSSSLSVSRLLPLPLSHPPPLSLALSLAHAHSQARLRRPRRGLLSRSLCRLPPLSHSLTHSPTLSHFRLRRPRRGLLSLSLSLLHPLFSFSI